MTSPPACVVVGSSGGLGASTLALAVGRRLAAVGPPATVVDLATTGGGLDVTAGVEHLAGPRWSALAGGGVPAVDSLLAALPAEDGCRVLSAGGPAPRTLTDEAVAETLAALVGHAAPLVVDAPATSGHLSLLLAGGPLVVVVAGLRTRQLADADALVDRLVDLTESVTAPADLRLVTRGARPSAGVLDDVEAHLGVAHLQHLPDDPLVAKEAERGLWPGTARTAVRRCADTVAAALTGARAGPVGRAS